MLSEPLTAYLRSQVRDTQLAADLATETFLKQVRGCRRLEGKPFQAAAGCTEGAVRTCKHQSVATLARHIRRGTVPLHALVTTDSMGSDVVGQLAPGQSVGAQYGHEDYHDETLIRAALQAAYPEDRPMFSPHGGEQFIRAAAAGKLEPGDRHLFGGRVAACPAAAFTLFAAPQAPRAPRSPR